MIQNIQKYEEPKHGNTKPVAGKKMKDRKYQKKVEEREV